MKPTTLIAPTCSCCTTPQSLLPREDLAAGAAACPTTGQFYHREGTGYRAADPPVPAATRPAPGVRIDLSRSGYA